MTPNYSHFGAIQEPRRFAIAHTLIDIQATADRLLGWGLTVEEVAAKVGLSIATVQQLKP